MIRWKLRLSDISWISVFCDIGMGQVSSIPHPKKWQQPRLVGFLFGELEVLPNYKSTTGFSDLHRNYRSLTRAVPCFHRDNSTLPLAPSHGIRDKTQEKMRMRLLTMTCVPTGSHATRNHKCVNTKRTFHRDWRHPKYISTCHWHMGSHNLDLPSCPNVYHAAASPILWSCWLGTLFGGSLAQGPEHQQVVHGREERERGIYRSCHGDILRARGCPGLEASPARKPQVSSAKMSQNDQWLISGWSSTDRGLEDS